MTNCLFYNVSMLGCHSIFKKSPMSEVTVMFLSSCEVKETEVRLTWIRWHMVFYKNSLWCRTSSTHNSSKAFWISVIVMRFSTPSKVGRDVASLLDAAIFENPMHDGLAYIRFCRQTSLCRSMMLWISTIIRVMVVWYFSMQMAF